MALCTGLSLKRRSRPRGDRSGIEAFNPAFVGLLGDDVPLTQQEMQEFEDFLATIYFPPNPFREFDNSLGTAQPAQYRQDQADDAPAGPWSDRNQQAPPRPWGSSGGPWD